MNDPSGRPDGGVGEQDVLALLAELDSELIGLAPVKYQTPRPIGMSATAISIITTPITVTKPIARSFSGQTINP